MIRSGFGSGTPFGVSIWPTAGKTEQSKSAIKEKRVFIGGEFNIPILSLRFWHGGVAHRGGLRRVITNRVCRRLSNGAIRARVDHRYANNVACLAASRKPTNVTIYYTLVAPMDDHGVKTSRVFRNVCRGVLQVLILTVLAFPALAQTVSFGVKGGVPIIDPFVLNSSLTSLNNYTFITQRYTVGPTFEMALPYRLFFEADALYKHLHYVSNPFGFDTFQAKTTATSWEIPLLLKHYLSDETFRPYGDVGVSFRHVGGNTTFSNSVFRTTQDPLELVHSWSTGFVAGGGIDVVYGAIHISPEIRYTRWATENFNSSSGVFNSNLNGLDVLIGVTFQP